MSISEQRAWLSLAAYGAIFAFFLMRMLAEDWSVAAVSAGHMLWTYGYVAVMAVVAESLIAASTAAREKLAGGAVEADERDLIIEARAEQYGGFAGLICVNAVVLHALLHATYPGHAFPHADLTSLPNLVLALLTVLFVAQAVKLVTTIVSYRL